MPRRPRHVEHGLFMLGSPLFKTADMSALRLPLARQTEEGNSSEFPFPGKRKRLLEFLHCGFHKCNRIARYSRREWDECRIDLTRCLLGIAGDAIALVHQGELGHRVRRRGRGRRAGKRLQATFTLSILMGFALCSGRSAIAGLDRLAMPGRLHCWDTNASLICTNAAVWRDSR